MWRPLSPEAGRGQPVAGKMRGFAFLSRFPRERGTQAEGLGGEGLAESGIQTLTSHRFAAGP